MITPADVERAIVDIYDVHVRLYGYDKNVFFIATASQVGQYLGVEKHRVTHVVRDIAKSGYTRYKQEVLVRAGRGRVVPSSSWPHISWFEPNMETF